MAMKRIFTAMAAMALLAACATATPYAPRGKGMYGFADQQIESNRFTVTFRGNFVTSRDQVEEALLYRAAELTLQRGFDYFTVVTRGTERNARYFSTGGPSPFLYDTWYFSPRRGWLGAYDPFWNDPISFQEITNYESRAEITLGKGAKPAGDAAAFDARAVEQNLAGRIVRPAKTSG
jgi:hypothetical protein